MAVRLKGFGAHMYRRQVEMHPPIVHAPSLEGEPEEDKEERIEL
jgi:hypothetical protein